MTVAGDGGGLCMSRGKLDDDVVDELN